MKLKPQQGVAIITALLIVALAATAATYLLWQQSLWTRQVENLMARNKANAIAQAGAQLARGQLNEFADTKVIYQFLGKELPLPAEGASLVGMMVDEQSKLNINNLIHWNRPPSTAAAAPAPTPNPQSPRQNPPSNTPTPPPRSNEDIFNELLKELKLPLTLTDSLMAWTDDNGQQPDDLTYLSKDPSYRSAHQRIVDINELYRVKDFTPEIIEKLRPYITALPTGTTLNVNTAPENLLEAAGLPSAVVADIIKKREATPFLKKEDLDKVLNGAALPPTVGFTSQYFVASGRVTNGNVDIGYSALLERSTTGSEWPRIIWLQQGTE
ncbi:MAG: type II secretion system minor pseudopilin GspK [Burkholderiales bacterium]